MLARILAGLTNAGLERVVELVCARTFLYGPRRQSVTMKVQATLSHHYLPGAGVTLHVVQAGPPDGTPLIFLHGFPEFWRGWIKQIDDFVNAGYRLSIPDLRGYNLSERPSHVRDYNLDLLAADVASLIRQTRREKVTLVGHDWGAAIGWWIALNQPELLDCLVILNVPHPTAMARLVRQSWEQRLRSWYVGFFQTPWLPEALLTFGNGATLARAMRASGRPDAFSDEQIQRYREAWSRPHAMSGMINWYRAIVRTPPKPPPTWRITSPTLIIWGVHDIALSRELAPLSVEMCDKGELVFLEEATHWLQHEEPAHVNRLILNFLSQHSPTPPSLERSFR